MRRYSRPTDGRIERWATPPTKVFQLLACSQQDFGRGRSSIRVGSDDHPNWPPIVWFKCCESNQGTLSPLRPKKTPCRFGLALVVASSHGLNSDAQWRLKYLDFSYCLCNPSFISLTLNTSSLQNSHVGCHGYQYTRAPSLYLTNSLTLQAHLSRKLSNVYNGPLLDPLRYSRRRITIQSPTMRRCLALWRLD